MKIVPLKNKTVEFVSKVHYKDRTYNLKIFDMTEGMTFQVICQGFRKASDKKAAELYVDLVELGLDSVKDESLKKLTLEWFAIQELGDQIIRLNTKTVENVKK